MARVAVIIVALMVLAQGLVHTAGDRVRAFRYAYERKALDATITQAEQYADAYLKSYEQTIGNPDASVTAPSPMATAAACSSPCRYEGAADFSISGQPTSSLSSGGISYTGNSVAYNLQRQSLIHEDTMSIQINAHVWYASSGSELTRCEMRKYRVLAQTPYAEPMGTSSCGANVGVSLEDDAGGCDPSSPTTCDPTGGTQTAPTNTTLQAIAVCKDTGGWVCSSGGATPTPRPQNSFVNNTWQSNDQKSGWTTH